MPKPNLVKIVVNPIPNPLQDRYPLKKSTPSANSFIAASTSETDSSQLRRSRTKLSDFIEKSTLDHLKKQLVYKSSRSKQVTKSQTIPEETDEELQNLRKLWHEPSLAKDTEQTNLVENTQENQPRFSGFLLTSIMNILIAAPVSLKNAFLSLCNRILNAFKPSKPQTANITKKSDTKKYSNLTIFATAEGSSKEESSIVNGPPINVMTTKAG